MSAYAYIRKSKVTNEDHVSYDVQLKAVTTLASQHGDAEGLVVLSDMNRSGTFGRSRRPGWDGLWNALESGQVSAVYGYDLSRMARSTKELVNLLDLCRERRIPLRLVHDRIDLTTASGEMQAEMLSSLAAFGAKLARERARDVIAHRRSRGDKVGSARFGFRLEGGKEVPNPDEDVDAVINAFLANGKNFARTARALNAAGVRPRWAKEWSGKAVGDVIRTSSGGHHAPPVKARAARMRTTSVLSNLVYCHCGQLMTTKNTKVNGKVYPSLQCPRGRYVDDHARPYMVGLSRLLPAIKEEAAHLHVPVEVQLLDDITTERAGIEGKLARFAELYGEGHIDRDTYEAKRTPLERELEVLDIRERNVEVPSTIDWAGDAVVVNEVLLSLFERVVVDEDMNPVRYDWRVPEWRGA